MQQKESLTLLDEALMELESPKGSVLSAVQKLSRAASIIGNDDVAIWCSIQLGDHEYTRPLRHLLSCLAKKTDEKQTSNKSDLDSAKEKLNELKLKRHIHYSNEEIHVKRDENGGGYLNIGFIEERYADLVRIKQGNDGTYYKINLNNHINYVRKKAHEFASTLFNQIKFAGTISSCFDLLRNAVDDRLLDLNPALAEQLMLAFKSVSSTKEEEWSQALTTCRRLLEGLADELYPACDGKSRDRSLDQVHYVNRLWAFMDSSIKSESNRELAKTHVDYLGSWLEKTAKISNKGVHSKVSQLEAVKAVFHTYLIVADILEYLDINLLSTGKPDINTATLDELEALLEVSRSVAKEIIKTRVQEGRLNLDTLSKVRGIGPKTIKRASDMFSF